MFKSIKISYARATSTIRAKSDQEVGLEARRMEIFSRYVSPPHECQTEGQREEESDGDGRVGGMTGRRQRQRDGGRDALSPLAVILFSLGVSFGGGGQP